MRAGKLDQRFTIQRDMAEPDWTGHPGEPDWQTLVGPIWVGIQFMRGGETVIAARLTATQPAILTLRSSPAALGIRPSDRAVSSAGEIFNIREKPRVSRDNPGALEMLVETGASV
ncbi:head-tail adaptor protein [Aquamicrobium sp.]|uniref:phage head completion protein n=1 Tax=Aquamicrobium sp. TaxID=1872579 RepID=UPI0025883E1B|nr:head-tail adaptor protein [Aquamicrobium sp.]MCK9551232.1 head-tail adaptor protein [Aquamicrobium sp.]